MICSPFIGQHIIMITAAHIIHIHIKAIPGIIMKQGSAKHSIHISATQSIVWRHVSLTIVQDPIVSIMLSVVIIDPIISGIQIMFWAMIFISIISICIGDIRCRAGEVPQVPSIIAGMKVTEELEESGVGT
jgi:hypothetical protein